MSNVIAFPRRPPPEPVQRFPPITPWPAWKYALRDRYWSRDNWRTSQRGNSYVVVDSRCITWFRQRDGWSWSISVSGSDDEPLWSKRLHASERDARTDAWDSLVTFYEEPKDDDAASR
jgi:hypothetical protein